jgi:hypothetical protein
VIEDKGILAKIRAAVRPLVIDTGIPETPLGLWGTCFLAMHNGQLFAVTAAHLVKGNHSGEVRILGSDDSNRRIPLSAGIGVLSDPTDDDVDVIVYPATLVGLSRREVRHAHIINLDVPELRRWNARAYESQFTIIGYPRELSEVDYDAGRVSAGQVLLTGSYLGPAQGRGTVHRLRVNNPLELDAFAGFSGSPVFSVEHQLAADAIIRFCGVAVTGTRSSEYMHFVEAAALMRLMHAASNHVRTFGMELPKRGKSTSR